MRRPTVLLWLDRTPAYRAAVEPAALADRVEPVELDGRPLREVVDRRRGY